MAGDWIKMRSNLWDDPRVSSMVDATDSSEASVIGALYWLWATADQHSSEGWMPGLTMRQIDRKTGVAGMAAALKAVGWIDVADDGITLARFTEHNGASAKRRGETARRVQEHRRRTCNAEVVTESKQVRYLEKEKEKEIEAKAKATEQHAAHDGAVPDRLPGDIAVPEPLEDGEGQPPRAAPRKPQTAVRFPEFWATYPVKKGKVDALKKWKAKGCDAIADQIIAHVRLMEQKDDDWLRGFIPHGSTYINGERWTDEPKRDAKIVTAPAPAADKVGAAAALKPTETKLDNAIGYIRQQYANGAYGSGDQAKVEAQRLIEEARVKYAQA